MVRRSGRSAAHSDEVEHRVASAQLKPNISAPVVKADIEAALKCRAQRDANEISVSVDGGDVTLSGKVHSWSERELATNTAWASPGVRKVVDKITLTY